MLVVFTDLDGTLLERDSCNFEPALPGLERLRRLQARVVFLSSKTLSEVLFWRTKLEIDDPFAVENGGAVYASKGNPSLPGSAIQTRGPYERVEFGIPYDALVWALKDAARESCCRVRGFADMTVQEISAGCRIDIEQAWMAKARFYDEPFTLIEGNYEDLRVAIERRGLRLTRSRRFFHIKGPNDKADAAELLLEAYKRLDWVRTIGIGDALHDAGFLRLVDCPIILDSPSSAELLERVPNAQLFPPGPRGWSRAILGITGLGD
jgi:mannosyl-3-phosphoglycerate phosphatase